MLLQSGEQKSVPEEGYALPAFALEDASGSTIRLWDYKQRRPVLLAFVHGVECACCRAWLRTLVERQSLLDELRVVTLVIVPEPVERLDVLRMELGSAAVVLSDADRGVAARYLPHASAARPEGHLVGLYAADRYLHCLGRWFAEDADAMPPWEEPMGEIAFAMQEGCGCSLPAWPPR